MKTAQIQEIAVALREGEDPVDVASRMSLPVAQIALVATRVQRVDDDILAGKKPSDTELAPKKKRTGRPKGSKNKAPAKRAAKPPAKVDRRAPAEIGRDPAGAQGGYSDLIFDPLAPHRPRRSSPDGARSDGSRRAPDATYAQRVETQEQVRRLQKRVRLLQTLLVDLISERDDP